MMKKMLMLLCLGCFVAGSAQAGIWKCKNAKTGRIEYSDVPCYGNQSGDTIEARPNVLDSSGSRQQVAITLQRKAEEDYRDRQQAARQTTASTTAKRASATGPDTQACRSAQNAYNHANHQAGTPAAVLQSLRNSASSVCSSDSGGSLLRNPVSTKRLQATAGSTVDKTSATPTTTPRVPATITNCDSAGCGDSAGHRYNRGGGDILIRNDGKTCVDVGTQVQCN